MNAHRCAPELAKYTSMGGLFTFAVHDRVGAWLLHILYSAVFGIVKTPFEFEHPPKASSRKVGYTPYGKVPFSYC